MAENKISFAKIHYYIYMCKYKRIILDNEGAEGLSTNVHGKRQLLKTREFVKLVKWVLLNLGIGIEKDQIQCSLH